MVLVFISFFCGGVFSPNSLGKASFVWRHKGGCFGKVPLRAEGKRMSAGRREQSPGRGESAIMFGRRAAIRASRWRCGDGRNVPIARSVPLSSGCREALKSPQREYSSQKSYLSSFKQASLTSASLRRNLHKLTAAPCDIKLSFSQTGLQGIDAPRKQYLIFFTPSKRFLSTAEVSTAADREIFLSFVFVPSVSHLSFNATQIHSFPPRRERFHFQRG